jgi:hypothetical protein
MRKMMLFAVVLFVAVAAWAAGSARSVVLQWDYPPAEMPDVVFYVYQSADLAGPVESWPVVGSVYLTNRAVVPVVPGRNYFAVAASNIWGRSFSSVVSTPALPRGDVNLRLWGIE